MKKMFLYALIVITTLQANAQTPVKKESKPLVAGNGKVENTQNTEASYRYGDRWGITGRKNLSTTDLEKLFWADAQIQALTKVEPNTNTQNNAAPEKKVKPFWEVGASYIILAIDPTSGTYVSTDSLGNKTNWLAIRYKGVDEKTKKEITLCMLKNVDKNITTVWAEDGVNNYSVNNTGAKTEVKNVKLGSNGTISFGQKSVADSDCRGALCPRCPGVGCNPYVTETNNQTQY